MYNIYRNVSFKLCQKIDFSNFFFRRPSENKKTSRKITLRSKISKPNYRRIQNHPTKIDTKDSLVSPSTRTRDKSLTNATQLSIEDKTLVPVGL